MVNGMPFIYNGISSEIYDVSLVFLDENVNKRPSGSGVKMITDTIKRNPKVLFLDSEQAPPLEFGIEVMFSDPVDIFTFTKVKDWLGGEISFRKLQICAENFQNFYFNCYIELKEDLIYLGGYRGVKATVHCDAPWAWQFEEKKLYSFEDTSKEHIVYFDNISADSNGLRPVLEITSDKAGECSIKNETIKKETKFVELLENETVKIDNLYGFISSDTGLRRISNFNKVFFVLKKGMNKLIVGKNVKKVKIIYENAVRIGGGYY